MAIIFGSLYYMGSHIFGCVSGGGATFLAVPARTEVMEVTRTGNCPTYFEWLLNCNGDTIYSCKKTVIATTETFYMSNDTINFNEGKVLTIVL